MNIPSLIEETIQGMLDKLAIPYGKITIKEEPEKESFRVNVESDEPSLLIGYHGENIFSFQHILKAILWKQTGDVTLKVIVDVDDYRKRQEENVVSLAERRVEIARNTNTDQKLPPMSPYFRRIVHLHLRQPEFDDISTESIGDDSHRQVIIKVK